MKHQNSRWNLFKLMIMVSLLAPLNRFHTIFCCLYFEQVNISIVQSLKKLQNNYLVYLTNNSGSCIYTSNWMRCFDCRAFESKSHEISIKPCVKKTQNMVHTNLWVNKYCGFDITFCWRFFAIISINDALYL